MTPTMVMLRAAQLLEEEADVLRQSHTRASGDGGWVIREPSDQLAKAMHDERLKIAAALRLLARPLA